MPASNDDAPPSELPKSSESPPSSEVASSEPSGPRGAEARREGLAVLAVLAVIFGGLACWRWAHSLERHASPAACTELRDRYLERMAVELEPGADAVRKAEISRGLAKRWTSVDECSRNVTQSEMDCALAAGSTDAVERCLH